MATAILSVSKPPAPVKGIPSTAKITPLRSRSSKEAPAAFAQRIRDRLDFAHLQIERLDSMIHVAVVALYGQDCDIDSGVATCLEAAVTAELEPARKNIEEALELFKEVTNG